MSPAKGLGGGHARKLAGVCDEGDRAHAGDVAILLGHESNPLANQGALGSNVRPEDIAPAGGGLDKSEQRLDKGRFPGAVGS